MKGIVVYQWLPKAKDARKIETVCSSPASLQISTYPWRHLCDIPSSRRRLTYRRMRPPPKLARPIRVPQHKRLHLPKLHLYLRRRHARPDMPSRQYSVYRILPRRCPIRIHCLSRQLCQWSILRWDRFAVSEGQTDGRGV